MSEFITFKKWLNEQKEQKKKEPEYGCVMMDAKIDDWEENHLNGIDEKDIHVKPYDDSYGLEDNPHITILYGIHEDEIDPEVINSVIENNLYPIEVQIDEIDIFKNDDYDVVKYNVPVIKDLKKFRKIFKKFPNTQKFPDYNPHITIAYVKSGKGEKYKRKLTEPFIVRFNKGVYSWHDEEDESLKRKEINLEDEEKV